MARRKTRDDADRFISNVRNGVYYYQRKVPRGAWNFDKRAPVFRVSLKTDKVSEARDRRDVLEAADDKLWSAVIAGGEAQSALDQHAAAVRLVEAMGFGYKPAEDIARSAPLREIMARVDAMGPADAPVHVERALLGNIQSPKTTVTEAARLYEEEIAADEIVGKSEQQKRKWRNVKRRGVDLFVDVVGDLAMDDLNREHGLKFWRMWQRRISPTGKGEKPTHTPSSGNRDISTMRTLYSAYFKHIGQHDRPNPFAGLSFKERGASKRKRPPFPVDHIRDVLMKPGVLAGMNGEARAILLAEIETGARPSELANIAPADIVLKHDVPHIVIQPRDDPDDPRELKSEQSERIIPLVGVALDVFRAFPNGFPRYRDHEEAASAAINKYLRENKLMPTARHTLYGLRHSLEDRMKEAGIDEELRRILMGHKINREEYGIGGSLEWRRQELEKVALPYDPSIVTLSKR